MTAREQLRLDGTWTFAPDPGAVGVTEAWNERRGFARPVEVPGPWQLYGEDMRGYTGFAWYHRAFEVPAAWASDWVALRFDAVDYATRVYVDGELLLEHEGGYTPFEVPIRPGAGVRHVVLRVDDPADNSEIPHGKQGSWYTRVSGPWQPVWLIRRPTEHVTALRVLPKPDERRVGLTLEAIAQDGTPVSVRVYAPDGQEAAVVTGEVAGGLFTAEAGLDTVVWWSPESPELYRAVAELGRDRFETTFGMRTIAYQDGRLLLNGEPLVVRGALDQGFWPQTIYTPPSLEAIEEEIRLAKAMGLNLLRKHIKLEDPRYLDACDRLGMLVWEEPACYAKHTAQARERFTAEIEAMIARDFNHPSIIAWSLYNEEWGLEWRLWRDADKQAHVEALYEHARRLDPSRLFCDNSGWAHVKTDLNDYHRYFAAPDSLAACEADLAHCLDRPEDNFVEGKKQNAEGVPVLVSEFGVWGLPEPSRIVDWYGERPWWFDARWAGHTEEFKYPATAERAFEKFRLAEVFGSLDALAKETQRRMMRALKPIIEAMRRRPDLAGWVVTELTDIEWESNGWLDYFRKPKEGFGEFQWFNGPVAVMARLDRHNVAVGEAIAGELWLSNHTREPLDGVVRWNAGEGLSDEMPMRVGAFGTERLAVTFGMATTNGPRTLAFAFEVDGRVVAENQEELTVSAPDADWGKGLGPVALAGGAAGLAEAFRQGGVSLQEAAPGVLLVTTALNASARQHLAEGGRVLLLAEDEPEASGRLSLRRLPKGESWDRASSVFYARPGLFEGLVEGVFGWELEGLYPDQVVPLAPYLQDFGGRLIELPGNQAGVDPAGIWAGYFEGWLGKFGAAILHMPYDEGELVVCTLKLLSGYGRQPVGTRLLHRLVALASGLTRRSPSTGEAVRP